jgi:hypothetical protein
VLASLPARAQPVDSAAAQALVEAGRALAAENKLAEACPKFREAARIAPPGLAALKQLAECYEKAGRLASAWTTWREVEAGARRAGQEERAADAQRRAAGLEPSLPRLAIEVSPAARDARGLEVFRDGVAIGLAQWGVAVPVDAGGHLVVARAPAHERWEVSLDVAASGRVTITVPGLKAEQAGAPARPLPLVEPIAMRGDPPGPVPRAIDPGSGRRAAGLVAGGAGIATLGAAILVQVLASADLGACPDPNQCPGIAGGHYEAGRREQFGADALYAVGGASLVAGVILYVTAPKAPAGTPPPQPQRPGRVARLGWRVAVTPAGIRLGGTW